MDEISQRDYWAEVQGVADDVAETLRDYADDYDGPYDVIHERVDGHQWMIYYHYQGPVMDYTDNPTALTDEMGGDALAGVTGWYDIRLRFAAWAFTADITEAYGERYDDDGKPHPDPDAVPVSMCSDCYCSIANGLDSIDVPDDRRDEIAAGLESAGPRVDIDTDDEGGFSMSPCQICGTRLGGTRLGGWLWPTPEAVTA